MSAKNADDLVAKADKKLASFGLFGNKYEDAAELLEKAAVQYKLAKACEFCVERGRERGETDGVSRGRARRSTHGLPNPAAALPAHRSDQPRPLEGQTGVCASPDSA